MRRPHLAAVLLLLASFGCDETDPIEARATLTRVTFESFEPAGEGVVHVDGTIEVVLSNTTGTTDMTLQGMSVDIDGVTAIVQRVESVEGEWPVELDAGEQVSRELRFFVDVPYAGPDMTTALCGGAEQQTWASVELSVYSARDDAFLSDYREMNLGRVIEPLFPDLGFREVTLAPTPLPAPIVHSAECNESTCFLLVEHGIEEVLRITDHTLDGVWSSQGLGATRILGIDERGGLLVATLEGIATRVERVAADGGWMRTIDGGMPVGPPVGVAHGNRVLLALDADDGLALDGIPFMDPTTGVALVELDVETGELVGAPIVSLGTPRHMTARQGRVAVASSGEVLFLDEFLEPTGLVPLPFDSETMTAISSGSVIVASYSGEGLSVDVARLGPEGLGWSVRRPSQVVGPLSLAAAEDDHVFVTPGGSSMLELDGDGELVREGYLACGGSVAVGSAPDGVKLAGFVQGGVSVDGTLQDVGMSRSTILFATRP